MSEYTPFKMKGPLFYNNDKKHIGGNFKKKIMGSKLVKDLKEAESIIVDDVNKLAGTKVHSGTGNKGRGRLIRGTSPQHKYWKKK